MHGEHVGLIIRADLHPGHSHGANTLTSVYAHVFFLQRAILERVDEMHIQDSLAALNGNARAIEDFKVVDAIDRALASEGIAPAFITTCIDHCYCPPSVNWSVR